MNPLEILAAHRGAGYVPAWAVLGFREGVSQVTGRRGFVTAAVCLSSTAWEDFGILSREAGYVITVDGWSSYRGGGLRNAMRVKLTPPTEPEPKREQVKERGIS